MQIQTRCRWQIHCTTDHQ